MLYNNIQRGYKHKQTKEGKTKMTTEKNSLTKLTELYKQWGDDNYLSPLGSADEEILRKDITHVQFNWLKNFIDIWEKAEEVEDFINEQTKGNK